MKILTQLQNDALYNKFSKNKKFDIINACEER